MQYPTIAQPQYGFGPTMPPGMYDTPPALMNFNKGGLASLSLPEMAERVEAAGRGGDTILAHITPEEAGILQLLGGSGTINPKTGQPEYVRKTLKKVVPKEIYKPISSLGKAIERGVESIAKALGPVGSIAAAYFGGPIGAALYQGLAAPGSSFDVKKAALAGGLTYATTGTLKPSFDYSGTFGTAPTTVPSTDVPPPTPAPSVVDAVGGDPYVYGSTAADYSQAAQPIPGQFIPSESGAGADIAMSEAADPNRFNYNLEAAKIADASAQPPATFVDRALEGLSSLPGKAIDVLTPTSAKDALLTASLATTAYGSIKSLQELEDQKKEAERILAAQEGKKQEDIAWAQGVLRDYPINYRRLTAEDVRAQQGMAGGGLASLNAFKSGGNPRFLKGGGDGMSDDIPATIGGRQKARLSDGEFVIPADVVSHLGNGSSRAGAKKLYKMMDNIRRARTGKRRQAPEVSADRYMPA